MRIVRSFIRPTGPYLAALACLFITHASLAAPSDQTVATTTTPVVKAEVVQKKVPPLRPTTMKIGVDSSVPIMFARPAATVFIANPEVADVQVLSAKSVMVFGKKAGQTTLIITDDYGKKLAYRSIVITQNLSELRKALRAVIPGSRIKVKSIPNGIVLSGTTTDSSAVEDARRLAARYLPAEGSEIINRIKVEANNQVQIRVRFAEVSKDVDKRFGIDWENIGSMGQFAVGLATGADFYTAGAAIARTVVGDSTNNAINFGFSNGNFNINGMVDALAKDGFVTILAEPSLTALSGQTASFLAGGEFPVPVPQSADTISIEWKQYGVSLAFTPTIINGDRINLHVRPEVSQLSDIGSIALSNITIPSLITRRAETTIELNSGQSFALAGLINNQQTQSIEKFPFLGDIPVLGALFRSTRFQNNETELVIIITPYIVKPVNQEDLSLPMDGIVAPTDEEFIFGMKNISDNKNARKLSGDDRAVIIKNSRAEGKASKLKAQAPSPVKAVKRTPVTKKKLAPLPKKKKKKIVKKKAKVVVKPVAKPAPVPAKKPTAVKKKATPPKKQIKAVVKKRTYPLSKPVSPKVKAAAPEGPGGFIVE